MNKEYIIEAIRHLLRSVYTSVGQDVDLTKPCPICGKSPHGYSYVFVKIASCADCGHVILAGATDGYGWIR